MAHQHDHGHAHDDHDHGAHDHGGHDHGHGRHGHGHHHHHAPADMGRAFAIGVILNTAFVAAEAGVGFWTGSLSLLADAGHNLSDVLSLLLAWGATILARRAPAGRRTYGMRKATILASLANAVLLLVAVGAIASESVHRLLQPSPVESDLVMLTAALGVVINGATALLFMRGAHSDLNVRGAFLHMAADAGVSLAVVVGAFAMSRTGLLWIDPALGLLIAAVIVFGTWGLLRDSVDLVLDAAPRGIDVDAVRGYLAGLPGVEGVHDLHVWALSTTETAMTAHLLRPNNDGADALLQSASAELAVRFRIGHATLQIETDDAGCGVGCAKVA
ncbi:cation diffusion facilitator family transporter [Phenylobacterium sp.]|uniref:cation diffusion facilitator family transporter n=1 Tax=Phenylobacterium sp. TaxID=1871053 RepID=UPI0025D15E2F|nr:cation diffusion facilitator family transporter [Phenylobacterium sp.]MBX3482765.1 cation transporter [Phenylobacterium sp.]MCW5758898.1 cation transporter [Phenylobacterium sp.]